MLDQAPPPRTTAIRLRRDARAQPIVGCPLAVEAVSLARCVACQHHRGVALGRDGEGSSIGCALPTSDVPATEGLASLEETAEDLPLRPGWDSGFRPIVGRSPTMVRLLKRLEILSSSDAPVLVTGESGTGKELVARLLHDRGRRAGQPFLALSCAAFPETLIEAELFGHERGAFTGAARQRDGRFKAADGGTLFLDEIAEIPLQSQVKLLRVLQEGTVEPLGANRTVSVNVRIISATHRNLKERIVDGLFREDLYYRLNVLNLEIPPLRERRGDLSLLVDHFLRRYVPRSTRVPSITPRAWAALSDYAFPGNVRELDHAIEHAVVMARGREIDLEHLPSDIVGTDAPVGELVDPGFRSLASAVRQFEREHILRALALTGGQKGRAANLLGISRKNLWQKLRAQRILGDPSPAPGVGFDEECEPEDTSAPVGRTDR